jgi:hypothetical protein
MSSPPDVSGVMGWLNVTFGWSIQVLPFSSPWFAPFTTLWSLVVPGPLPSPDLPFPWTIEVTGTWTPAGAGFALGNIAIVVGGGPPDGLFSGLKRALKRTRKRKRARRAR